MSIWVVKKFLEFSDMKNIDIKNTEITFLGYSFKENCPDIRNTKVRDLIFLVKDLGVNISLWDPIVDINELKDIQKEGIKVFSEMPNKIEFAFLCVNHDQINDYLKNYKGLVFDYKNIDFN